MKRLLFLVLMAFVNCIYGYADQYVIEELSTTTISIGGIEKTVGDKFSDTSTIKWSSPKQFMRARNLDKQGAKSKKFYQAAFMEKQATSIADYYIKLNRLSTMGPGSASKVSWYDGRNKTKYPEKRKAIVIGNSEYIYENYLLNPVGDAILVTEKLQDLGFDVATCYDGQVSDMKRTLNSFCDKAKDCDVVLFYYTGHGLQSKDNSINYLLPVNINTESGYDYVNERTCLSGLDVRDKILELQCKVNILLFDACRSDALVKGFSSSAFTMEAGKNTVVMYSTSNGNVAYDGYRGGKNGPFASAFLDNVGTPGITLSATLKKIQIKVEELSNGQTPSISDNVVTDFFFEPDSNMVVSGATVQSIPELKPDSHQNTKLSVRPEHKSEQQPVDKSSLFKPTSVYASAQYQFGELQGFNFAVGGYINNLNIQGSYVLGLNNSEVIHWSSSHGGLINDYAPHSFSLKLGYAFGLSNRFRVTPQIGGGMIIACTGDEEVSWGDAPFFSPASAVSLSVGMRLEVAFNSHVGLCVSPEFDFPIVMGDTYKVLRDYSSTIKGYSLGFNGSIGLYGCF